MDKDVAKMTFLGRGVAKISRKNGHVIQELGVVFNSSASTLL